MGRGVLEASGNYANRIDLLDAELPTDWHQLTACGVDPEFLTSLEPSDETRTAFGIEFRRYVARSDSTPEHLPVELFWNAEHSVPLLVVYRSERGEMQQRLVSLRFETREDSRLLLAQRFRPYDRTTVAAFREQHLQCPLVRTPR